MTPFIESLDALLGALTVASHLALGACLAGLMVSASFRARWRMFAGRWGMHAAWVVALGAAAASLTYSEVAGYAPCALCWWQRVFLYPIVVVLGVALTRRDQAAAPYALALAVPGALIAAYHSFISYVGSSGACDPGGVSCAARYVWEFGYVTIPLMSLTAFTLLTLFLWSAVRAVRAGER